MSDLPCSGIVIGAGLHAWRELAAPGAHPQFPLSGPATLKRALRSTCTAPLPRASQRLLTGTITKFQATTRPSQAPSPFLVASFLVAFGQPSHSFASKLASTPNTHQRACR